MNDCKTGLTWVHAPAEFGVFKPYRPPSAETPQGVYTVVRGYHHFDAWFISHEGAVTFLGSSWTVREACRLCERREGRRHADPRHG
jgi:hypothetical protein